MACKSRRQQGQWSLIGLLAALAIVMIMAATVYPEIAARHSQPGEPRTPLERGYGTACTAYVGQMNQAVTMYKMDHDDRPPMSVEQLKKYGVTDDMIHADGCYFVIDPQSGNVVDRGLSQTNPQAPPSSYTDTPPQGTPNLPNGFHGDDNDGGQSGITPSTSPQSGQQGGGGYTVPTIPTSGM